MVCEIKTILVFVLVDIAIAGIFNESILDNPNNLQGGDVNLIESRRLSAIKSKKRKVHRSTSSSSGEQRKEEESEDKKENSYISEVSGDSSSTDTDEKINAQKKRTKPKSSKERTGWRKWHRKCTPCPDDMQLKWRDPKIKWICGSYQLARRSFKSLCMMRYRNCQDGTMFTKVADGRCTDSTDAEKYVDHFFYDYKVSVSGDSPANSKSEETKSSNSSADVSS